MLRGALISEIQLNQEKEYIGGRKDGCDIRLQAEKGISREHFKLKFSDGKWILEAISRFGDVFSGGQKVENIDLQHGQGFQIPPYDFLFSDIPESEYSVQNRADNVIPIDENERTVIGAAQQVPYIKMVNSSGEVIQMLRLEVGDVWVAGRDPACQIIIPDQRVSRRQYEIYKVNGAYTILDLGSSNGTFLNGSPVSSTDPQSLKSGDAITVLDNTMYFEQHDPNFKYKIEKIEVPPIHVEELENINLAADEAPPESIPEPMNPYAAGVPEVDDPNAQQQLMTSEMPFTGMPGGAPGTEGQDQYQYYDFQQNQTPPPPVSGFKKLMQNRPVVFGIAIVFLMAAYFLSEMTEAPKKTAVVVSDDPFSKLTPEEQKSVKEYYSIAEQMYNQGQYDLALEQIRKLKKIIPEYLGSENIAIQAEQNNLSYLQRKKEEEARLELEKIITRNQEILDNCEKMITENVVADELRSCLTPVLANPGRDDFTERATQMLSKVESMESELKRKKEEEIALKKQVQDLEKLFKDAEETQNQGFAFKAIKKYERVVSSNIPDTQNYKEKAAKRINFIREKIKEKSQISIDAAQDYVRVNNLKEAIKVLREATIYDPDNLTILKKIETYSDQLKNQVRLIYQESIIDENYGIIENTETKEGAKEKWKKITETDLEDGEYFRKAIIKLHRYGVM